MVVMGEKMVNVNLYLYKVIQNVNTYLDKVILKKERHNGSSY